MDICAVLTNIEGTFAAAVDGSKDLVEAIAKVDMETPFISAATNVKTFAEGIANGELQGDIVNALMAILGEFSNVEIPEWAMAITEELKQGACLTAAWVKDNPLLVASIVMGIVLLAAPGVVSSPALSLVGYGLQGISAGSMAAGIQSGSGHVIAGSPFAVLQSAGMSGYGLPMVNGVVQAAGAMEVIIAAAKVIIDGEMARQNIK